MITSTIRNILLATGMVVACLALPVQAQEDNTGTNPVNFSYDYRLYMEMADLPIDDSSLITNTIEFRWPLGRDVANLKGVGAGSPYHDMGSRFAMRLRARHSNLSVEIPDTDPYSVSGIGDLDARLLYLPYVGNKTVLAVGLEGFFNTATSDALGSGKTSLGPTVIVVFPGLLGRGSLFAPAYQYVFDVGGSDDRADIGRSQLDLYFVWTLAGGKGVIMLKTFSKVLFPGMRMGWIVAEEPVIDKIILLNHAQSFDSDEISLGELRGVDIIVEAGATGFQSQPEADGPFNFLRPEDRDSAGEVPYPLVLEDSEGNTVLMGVRFSTGRQLGSR